MLRLLYSNRQEALASALAEELARVRGAAGGFMTAETIVVPSSQVAAYLKYAIARQNGLVANLEFPFLDGFLGGVLESEGCRVLDREILHWLLIGAMEGERTSALPSVHDYVHADRDPIATEKRRYQLAGELARLFIEYSIFRPEMIESWTRDATGATETATEAWQRELWRSVVGPGGDIEALASKDQWRTLVGHFRSVDASRLTLPRRLHIFGFSYFARGYQEILARLSPHLEIAVYTLNPCREFWDDVGTEAGDTPLLSSWGRPGRESIRMLNEQTDFDFQDAFVEPRIESSLGALQCDLLERAPEQNEPSTNAGVHVLACPNIRRELEIIGNEISSLLRHDDSLQMNQIAVLFAGRSRETYQAHLPSVFGELSLPHHMVDLPMASESRIGEAVELLLEYPLGRFTREETLRVITHPALVARYPDIDADEWIHFAERLGISHGADQSDHRGTYIERDLYSWDQGVRRLALGAFMSGEHDGERRAIRLGAIEALPEELSAGASISAARFSIVVRSLIADARFCRESEMPLSEWVEFFDLYLRSYLSPDTSAEERDLGQCREAIRSLKRLDLDRRRVGYSTVQTLARDAIEALGGSRGAYLADGVSVGALAPMRALPFRAIFVAGLGAGEFPATERESPLDLRSVKRLPGDVSPRDRDAYLLLETLLSARDHLYLSYVARDDKTGEDLPPSPLLLEITEVLGAGYGGAHEVRHPLRRFDRRYFPEIFSADVAEPPAWIRHEDRVARSRTPRNIACAPAVNDGGVSRHVDRVNEEESREIPGGSGRSSGTCDGYRLESVHPAARNEARALALREHLVEHCRERGCALPDERALRGELSRPERRSLAELLALPVFEGGSDRSEEPVDLPLSALRRFLETPLQSWASVILGIGDGEEADLMARRDEPFETEFLDSLSLLRSVFGEHLTEGDGDIGELLARYQHRATLEELSSSRPTGIFAEEERARHIALLRSWGAQLEPWRESDAAVYHFGRARLGEPRGELLPPLRLELDGRRVEISGTTSPILGGAMSATFQQTKPKEKHALRGIIDHLVLSAAGVLAGADHTILVLGGDNAQKRWHMRPWSVDQARDHLETMVRELLGRDHDYLLPCEAVFAKKKKPELALSALIADAIRKRNSSAQHGPVSRIGELSAPPDADLMMRRRFAPFFDRLEEVDG